MIQLARVKYLLLVSIMEGSYIDFPFSFQQRMDLGECTKIHDLALRADYEIASKERDLFFELDVSTKLLLWKLPHEVIWLNSRTQWAFQLAMLFDVLSNKNVQPLPLPECQLDCWLEIVEVIMALATPFAQLAGRLLWHSLHPTPAALYQVIVTWWPVPEGDLTLKALWFHSCQI